MVFHGSDPVFIAAATFPHPRHKMFANMQFLAILAAALSVVYVLYLLCDSLCNFHDLTGNSQVSCDESGLTKFPFSFAILSWGELG